MPLRSEAIGPDSIDIWTWNLDAPPTSIANLSASLSAEERARAARFVRERDSHHFIVGRARMRSILGRYLGMPPEALCFAYNDYGKPAVVNAGRQPLHFNLSHSADLAALAVSDHYVLGVDIEEIRFLKEDIARQFFSRKEYLTLRALPPEVYLDGFYRCWTRKEAFVKAHGAGLSLPLDSFDVTFDWHSEPRLERLEGDPAASMNWCILELNTPPNFAGAVVALTHGHPVRLRYRNEEADAARASASHQEHSARPLHRNDGSPADRP